MAVRYGPAGLQRAASPRVAHHLGGEPLGPFDAEPLRAGETCGDCLHPYWAHAKREHDEMRRIPCTGRPSCRCRREWSRAGDN